MQKRAKKLQLFSTGAVLSTALANKVKSLATLKMTARTLYCESWRGLTVKGKALHVPVERVERVVGGDHGAARGQQREADNITAAHHQFGVRLRRDADDAALSAEGRGDVEIAETIERESLGAAESAEKRADFSGRIDAIDAIVTRSGGAGDVGSSASLNAR